MEAEWPNGIGIHARVNIQEGEEVLANGDTSPLRHAAPWFGVLRLQYQEEALQMELNFRYHSAFSHDELPESEKNKPHIYALNSEGLPFAPAWYTLDFRALYHVSDTFSISGGVENLTNQRYRPYSSGLAGPGRNVVLSGRVNF